MKTTPDGATTAGQAGPNAREWVLIALLGIIGVVGIVIGRQQLEALRSGIATARTAEVRQLPEPLVAAAEVTVAPPAVEEVELLTPAQLRVNSLGRLASILRSQKIGPQPTGPAARIALLGGTSRIPLPAFLPDGTGRFPPSFADAFGLSEEEFGAVNDASADLKQRVDAAVLANTRMVEAGPDSYRLETSASSESAALRDQYIATMWTLLGPDRYQTFALLHGEVDAGMAAATLERQMKQAAATGATLPPALLVPSTRPTGPAALFDSFAGTAKTVTITKSVGRYTYQSSGSSNAGGSSDSLDRIRPVIGPAAALLPAGF